MLLQSIRNTDPRYHTIMGTRPKIAAKTNVGFLELVQITVF